MTTWKQMQELIIFSQLSNSIHAHTHAKQEPFAPT